MSIYSATFIGAVVSEGQGEGKGDDGARRFAEICRFIRDRDAVWLAASPTNLTIDHTVRRAEGCPWISVESALDGELLAQISRELETVALAIHVSDEIRLGFSYTRLERGNVVRALMYEDQQRPDGRGAWTKAEGKHESWERMLFSPSLKELYLKYAPDEVEEGCRDNSIKRGFSVPWACEGSIVADIAADLGLPWRPLTGEFPGTVQSELIGRSAERWKRFHREHRRPWWKLW